MADLYATERGYGVPLQNSLIRSHANSLDSLFIGYLDHIINFCHPTMQERIDAIQEVLGARPELKNKAKEDLDQLNSFTVEIPKR